MKVPILEIPEKVSELCTSYSPFFSRPQYNQFERYITSLFVSDEANVQSLAEGFRISQSYDSLHNFVSESPWDIDDVLEQTVRILKNLPDEERLTEEGIDKSKLSFGELKRRSFGQTLRMLIKKTIELNNANLNEEQILKILKI